MTEDYTQFSQGLDAAAKAQEVQQLRQELVAVRRREEAAMRGEAEARRELEELRKRCHELSAAQERDAVGKEQTVSEPPVQVTEFVPAPGWTISPVFGEIDAMPPTLAGAQQALEATRRELYEAREAWSKDWANLVGERDELKRQKAAFRLEQDRRHAEQETARASLEEAISGRHAAIRERDHAQAVVRRRNGVVTELRRRLAEAQTDARDKLAASEAKVQEVQAACDAWESRAKRACADLAEERKARGSAAHMRALDRMLDMANGKLKEAQAATQRAERMCDHAMLQKCEAEALRTLARKESDGWKSQVERLQEQVESWKNVAERAEAKAKLVWDMPASPESVPPSVAETVRSAADAALDRLSHLRDALRVIRDIVVPPEAAPPQEIANGG